MALFESMLLLSLLAIVLLPLSRKLSLPYPTVLAAAGLAVAALPWAPRIDMDPQLALALFIAPALLDAAYDMPPRTLRRFWVPTVALAAVAVILTAIAVAWLGVVWAGMPWAVALALGAIVAPPDAAAAAAMLSRLTLPRRTVQVLTAESLLNDAVALLIFGAAVATVTAGDGFASTMPTLALAAPGGVVLGLAIGRLYVVVAPRLQGTRLSETPPPAAGERAAEAAPQPAPAPRKPEVLVHLQARGDIMAPFGEWVGEKSSGRWIEGFAIAPDGVAPGDIEYQAVLGKGWLSPWVEGAQFCGSRGMALPVLGHRVVVVRAGQAEGVQLLVGHFVLAELPAVGADELQRAGLNPLIQ